MDPTASSGKIWTAQHSWRYARDSFVLAGNGTPRARGTPGRASGLACSLRTSTARTATNTLHIRRENEPLVRSSAKPDRRRQPVYSGTSLQRPRSCRKPSARRLLRPAGAASRWRSCSAAYVSLHMTLCASLCFCRGRAKEGGETAQAAPSAVHSVTSWHTVHRNSPSRVAATYERDSQSDSVETFRLHQTHLKT